MLLPAYLLFVLHSIIPHHHHFQPIAETSLADKGHHADDHHHDHHHGTDQSRGHNHQEKEHHFVHTPEFGNAMLVPGFQWLDCPEMKAKSNFSLLDLDFPIASSQNTKKAWHPEDPPLYKDVTSATTSSRGPPTFASES
jgi:hypothetical protein